jgi:O-antigen ligase
VQKGTFNGRLYWVFSPIEMASNAFGPFVNRNHFAGWMLMTASLAAGYLCSLVQPRPHGQRRRRSWRDRAAALASANSNRLLFTSCALAVMALSIVWTMSRSGIGAFVVATSVLALLAATRFRGSRRMVTVAWLLSVVFFALWWKGLDTMADWYGRTSTLEWRVQLWKDTAAIIRDFPWFGTGLNTYGVSTLLYPMTDRSWHAMEAHSDYVQIASEGGLALGLAAAFLAVQIARTIRTAFAEPQPSPLYWIRVGATLGLAAIAVQELSDFSLQMPGNAVLFVLLAAIAMHRPRRRQTPIRQDKPVEPAGPSPVDSEFDFVF